MLNVDEGIRRAQGSRTTYSLSLAVYLKSYEAKNETLHAQLERKNYGKCARLAKAIKADAKDIGAQELERLCARLVTVSRALMRDEDGSERLLEQEREGFLEEAERLYEQILEECAEAAKDAKALISNMGSWPED